MWPIVASKVERRRASRDLVSAYDFRAPVDYETRAVAFFDILGWGKAVEDSVTDAGLRRQLLNAIWHFLARTKEYVETETAEYPSGDEYTQFSDSMVVSFPYDSYRDLLRLLRFVTEFQGSMIMNGFPLRGGVTVGLIFHTETFAFGPAMNRAYHLESVVAKAPRIIVDQALDEDVRAATTCLPEHWPLVLRGDDGYYETDFLAGFARSEKLVEIIDQKIEGWIIQHKNDQRILRKYEWLSNRWNASKLNAAKYVRDK